LASSSHDHEFQPVQFPPVLDRCAEDAIGRIVKSKAAAPDEPDRRRTRRCRVVLEPIAKRVIDKLSSTGGFVSHACFTPALMGSNSTYFPI